MLCGAGAVPFMSAESSVRSRCIPTLRAEQEEKGQIPEQPFAYENESNDTTNGESILMIAFAVNLWYNSRNTNLTCIPQALELSPQWPH